MRSRFCWFSSSFFTFWYLWRSLFEFTRAIDILLVVLYLALLQALVHASLDLLPQSVHLIGLLLDKGGLGSHNLFVALLHVSFALFLLHLLGLNLDLVRLGVLLLAGQLLLDLLQVQKLGTLLEGKGQLLL